MQMPSWIARSPLCEQPSELGWACCSRISQGARCGAECVCDTRPHDTEHTHTYNRPPRYIIRRASRTQEGVRMCTLSQAMRTLPPPGPFSGGFPFLALLFCLPQIPHKWARVRRSFGGLSSPSSSMSPTPTPHAHIDMIIIFHSVERCSSTYNIRLWA